MNAAVAALLAALLAAGAGSAAAQQRPVDVEARPIASFGGESAPEAIGDLTFLGGLELSSDDPDFGSLSGIDFAPDGRLHAVTDRGVMFSARLEEADGVPHALTNAWMAPLRDPDGNIPERKAERDAESLRFVRHEGAVAALVSFENLDQIRVFAHPFDPQARPERRPMPRFARGLAETKGLEALAVAPTDGPLAGALVAIAERSTDSNGNHRGFVLGGPRAGAFSIGRTDAFDVTDAVCLPDGDLLLLERRFSFSGGLAVRLRLIRGDLIRPGRTVDGRVLLEAGGGYQIDNLEGIAVRPTAEGPILLTLVSDANHNILQRTLLLQFAFQRPPPPVPRRRPSPADGS